MISWSTTVEFGDDWVSAAFWESPKMGPRHLTAVTHSALKSRTVSEAIRTKTEWVTAWMHITSHPSWERAALQRNERWAGGFCDKLALKSPSCINPDRLLLFNNTCQTPVTCPLRQISRKEWIGNWYWMVQHDVGEKWRLSEAQRAAPLLKCYSFESDFLKKRLVYGGTSQGNVTNEQGETIFSYMSEKWPDTHPYRHLTVANAFRLH